MKRYHVIAIHFDRRNRQRIEVIENREFTNIHAAFDMANQLAWIADLNKNDFVHYEVVQIVTLEDYQAIIDAEND